MTMISTGQLLKVRFVMCLKSEFFFQSQRYRTQENGMLSVRRQSDYEEKDKRNDHYHWLLHDLAIVSARAKPPAASIINNNPPGLRVE